MPSPPLPLLVVSTLTLAAVTARPALADGGVAPAAAPSTAPAPLRPTAPAPPPAADSTRTLRFTSGISLTGIGVTAVILGSVIGVRALVSKNDVGAHCDAAGTCDLTGYTYGVQAQDLARFATICFGAGLALTGIGVGLVVSSKPWKPGLGPRTSAWIAPTRSGVVLGARW